MFLSPIVNYVHLIQVPIFLSITCDFIRSLHQVASLNIIGKKIFFSFLPQRDPQVSNIDIAIESGAHEVNIIIVMIVYKSVLKEKVVVKSDLLPPRSRILLRRR